MNEPKTIGLQHFSQHVSWIKGACVGVLVLLFVAGAFTAVHAGEASQSGDGLLEAVSSVVTAMADDVSHESTRMADAQAAHAAEIHCLALNIYFEARGEPDTGQRAVAHVVMNRAAHPRFPSSVCDVVRQGGEKRRHRCQFSWWCDGRSDRPSDQDAWREAQQLAQAIYAGELPDITGGALWYHADYVAPYWSKVLLKGDKIGQHIFYLEKQSTENML